MGCNVVKKENEEEQGKVEVQPAEVKTQEAESDTATDVTAGRCTLKTHYSIKDINIGSNRYASITRTISTSPSQKVLTRID